MEKAMGTPRIMERDSLPLPEYKKEKILDIDLRSALLIEDGFEYQGKRFSLSTNAQINISALNQTRNDLTYPITYNTIDDTDTYDVVDATDMNAMYMTALATKKAVLDSGTSLKTQVRQASAKDEVDAVIDNR